MLDKTKLFLTGLISAVSLSFIVEMGFFSQCTPMNINKNSLSPEELFMYVAIECGKSPITKFIFLMSYIFGISYVMFSYYVFKWAGVPIFVWFIFGVPLIVTSLMEVYYHRFLIKTFSNQLLENEELEKYVEVITASYECERSLVLLLGILMVLSFIYKKKKSK